MSSKSIMTGKKLLFDATMIRIEFQDKLVKSEVWQSCVNCEEFDDRSEMCAIHKARPPAHIIVSGCKDHMTDVPF